MGTLGGILSTQGLDLAPAQLRLQDKNLSLNNKNTVAQLMEGARQFDQGLAADQANSQANRDQALELQERGFTQQEAIETQQQAGRVDIQELIRASSASLQQSQITATQLIEESRIKFEDAKYKAILTAEGDRFDKNFGELKTLNKAKIDAFDKADDRAGKMEEYRKQELDMLKARDAYAKQMNPTPDQVRRKTEIELEVAEIIKERHALELEEFEDSVEVDRRARMRKLEEDKVKEEKKAAEARTAETKARTAETKARTAQTEAETTAYEEFQNPKPKKGVKEVKENKLSRPLTKTEVSRRDKLNDRIIPDQNLTRPGAITGAWLERNAYVAIERLGKDPDEEDAEAIEIIEELSRLASKLGDDTWVWGHVSKAIASSAVGGPFVGGLMSGIESLARGNFTGDSLTSDEEEDLLELLEDLKDDYKIDLSDSQWEQ